MYNWHKTFENLRKCVWAMTGYDAQAAHISEQLHCITEVVGEVLRLDLILNIKQH